MEHLTDEERAVILKEVDKLLDHTHNTATCLALKAIRGGLVGQLGDSKTCAQQLCWLIKGERMGD
jgi:hypothetical protein